MSYELAYRSEEIFAFMKCQMPGLSRSEFMRFIGLKRDGQVIAGMAFENINKHNIWVHLVGAPGRRWMVRKFLFAAFVYAFNICGCQRLSAYISASNIDSIRLAEHVGFKKEAVLSGAAQDGGDVFIFVLWKSECRYVQQPV
jgi:RimJ/RimL family protein N-acetyltransferase